MLDYKIVHAKVCETCAHYRRHYIRLSGTYYLPIWYGHCKYPRAKRRRPDQKSVNWLLSSDRED